MIEGVLDPHNRARLAKIMLLIWLAAEIVSAINGLYLISVLGEFGPPKTEPDYDLLDRVDGVISMVVLVTFILSAVMVSRWIMRVNDNAQKWSNGVTITPGWNVAWFFVPLASLYKPFQGIRETWQASIDPAYPESVDVPIIMRLWWAFYLAMSAAGNVSFRLSLGADTAEQFIFARWFEIASLLIDLPTTILLIMLIRQLTAIQQSVILTHDRETAEA